MVFSNSSSFRIVGRKGGVNAILITATEIAEGFIPPVAPAPIGISHIRKLHRRVGPATVSVCAIMFSDKPYVWTKRFSGKVGTRAGRRADATEAAVPVARGWREVKQTGCGAVTRVAAFTFGRFFLPRNRQDVE